MAAPLVLRTRAELEAALRPLRRGAPLSLVPTMGALHAGHAALVAAAQEHSESVVVTIFVNPLQFGPAEDLDRYPRTLAADLAACAELGVTAVFAPGVDEVYPGGEPVVTVDPGPDRHGLEGAVRPGHFRGVLTVCAKLFGLVRPDIAYFGEKDYEQLVTVRRMVADLCLPLAVAGVATVREEDGLALSSRNRHLSPAERAQALVLCRALRAGAERGPAGPDAVRGAAQDVLAAQPEVVVDYLALTGPDLGPPPARGPARLLVAGRVGATRLLDNTPVHLGAP